MPKSVFLTYHDQACIELTTGFMMGEWGVRVSNTRIGRRERYGSAISPSEGDLKREAKRSAKEKTKGENRHQKSLRSFVVFSEAGEYAELRSSFKHRRDSNGATYLTFS